MRVDAEARDAGRMAPSSVDEAVRCFEHEGFVVLEGCLPDALVAELREHYESALNDKIRRLGIRPVTRDDPRALRNDSVMVEFRPEGGNHDFNRWNMHLPSRSPFLDERVIANPFAIDVLDRIVGPDAILKRAASDTALPRAAFQNIHRDLHGDIPTVQVTLNVPLVDCTDDNAPLEVWPRSHLHRPDDPSASYSPTVETWTKEETARYARALPSTRLLVPRGTLILRDTRLLHRGTPNRSDQPRPMLSLTYRAPPAGLPPSTLLLAAGRLALAMRERGRREGRIDMSVLNAGNLLGRHVEALGGTDRDERRPIPIPIWMSYSARAKRLLRFASLDVAHRATLETSWRPSLELLWVLAATSCMAGAGIAAGRFRRASASHSH